MTDHCFPAREKLKHKKEISLLFEKGKWRTCGNLRIITLNLETNPQEGIEVENQRFGVSVSKRNFKKAVDRNRIKRLLRESYRLNKNTFTEAFGTSSISMLFWIAKEKPKHFDIVQDNFIKLCESKK